MAAPGGGDFVPFVWKNLDGREKKRDDWAQPFIQPLGQTSLVSSRTRQQHNTTHSQAGLLFIFAFIIYDVQLCIFFGGGGDST